MFLLLHGYKAKDILRFNESAGLKCPVVGLGRRIQGDGISHMSVASVSRPRVFFRHGL